MNILLIEPYYGGSHKAWADGFQAHSAHHVQLLTMPAHYWKWRMQGGAVSLARLYEEGRFSPDVILATDMFDLSTFLALTRRRTSGIPTALYFHENQFTYPRNGRQEHFWQYGFINYVSALSADAVYFNSAFHRESFLGAVPNMLKHFADWNELQSIEALERKCSVVPLGIDLQRYGPYIQEKSRNEIPLIIWNHRWEEDKRPDLFLQALYSMASRSVPFQVALLGENTRHDVPEFDEAKMRLGSRILHYGYVASFEQYARLLCRGDLAVSTAYQDFFGTAVVEAIYCGAVPVLPSRLNYPALIPEDFHDACLYEGNDLYPLLMRHTTREISVDSDQMRQHVAQFDWATIAPLMDNVLSRLVQAQ